MRDDEACHNMWCVFQLPWRCPYQWSQFCAPPLLDITLWVLKACAPLRFSVSRRASQFLYITLWGLELVLLFASASLIARLPRSPISP